MVAFVILGGYLNQADKIPNEIYFAGIATLITIFISIINYNRANDEFFKELFTEFNQRYDALNGFLFQINETDILTDTDKKRIMDYINLCSEEYMWVKKGRIPHHIWNSWKNGIELHLKKSPIRQVFEQERNLWKSSYYGFFDDLKM